MGREIHVWGVTEAGPIGLVHAGSSIQPTGPGDGRAGGGKGHQGGESPRSEQLCSCHFVILFLFVFVCCFCGFPVVLLFLFSFAPLSRDRRRRVVQEAHAGSLLEWRYPGQKSGL